MSPSENLLVKYAEQYAEIVQYYAYMMTAIQFKEQHANNLHNMCEQLKSRCGKMRNKDLEEAIVIMQNYDHGKSEYITNKKLENSLADSISSKLTVFHTTTSQIYRELYPTWNLTKKRSFDNTHNPFLRKNNELAASANNKRPVVNQKAENAINYIDQFNAKATKKKEIIQQTFSYLLALLITIPEGMCLAGVSQACTVSGAIKIGEILALALSSESLAEKAPTACDKFIEMADFMVDRGLSLPYGTLKTKIIYAKDLLQSSTGVTLNLCPRK